MIRQNLLPLLLLLGPALGAQNEELHDHVDRTGDGVAYVEWEASVARPMVGQEVVLRVRFGVSQAFFAEHLVQPFRQPLDLPVALRFGDLDELAALEWLGPWSSGERSFVLGGDLAGAAPEDGDRAGQPFRGATLTRSLRLTRPGPVTLPAPRLEFASATGFREDLVHGRVALDRRDEVVRGQPLELTVLDLPEDDRPPDFNGAVGRFEVWATVLERSVRVGETIPVVVEVEGEGDLGDALAHWPERVAGFQIQGRVVNGREVRLDLVALGEDVVQLPSLALVSFDPDQARYVTALSETVPIEVRGPETSDVRSETPARVEPARGPGGGRGEVPSGWGNLALLLAGLGVVLAAGILLARRRAATDGFAWVLEAELLLDQLEGGMTHDALVGLLARGLGCAPPGVAGPGLGDRLRSAGLAGGAADAVEVHLRRWEDARFGDGTAPTADEVEQVVARIADV